MKSIMKIFIQKTGFTLVELIVALTILGIIIAPISYIFYNSQIDYLAGKRKIDTQRDINNALRDINDSLNQVETSKIDTTYNTIDILDISGGNDYIILRYSNKEIIYGVEGGKLYKGINTNVSPATNRKNAADLSTVLSSLPAPNKQMMLGNVKDFSIVKDTIYKFYEITIASDPDDYGKNRVEKITLSNKFTPRFDMDIR